MSAWFNGQALFYTGIVLISLAAVGAIISVIILRISKSKLNKKLDAEFGCKH